MVIKNLCILVFKRKIASALEGLNGWLVCANLHISENIKMTYVILIPD